MAASKEEVTGFTKLARSMSLKVETSDVLFETHF